VTRIPWGGASSVTTPQQIKHLRSRLLRIFSHRNAIGSSHNVRLARSRAADWNVTLRPATSYRNRGLNLCQRERHAHLAGEVITPDCTGDPHMADPPRPFLFLMPNRRKKKKCTAERPSCKLCRSTDTEKDCIYEPTWRVLSATDIESISRRTSSTPVSSSEDGESSHTDDYDCPSWAGDYAESPVYESHTSERQIVDASLCQDYHPTAPHQMYPTPCGSVLAGELKHDG
jgi:hypothetical protein